MRDLQYNHEYDKYPSMASQYENSMTPHVTHDVPDEKKGMPMVGAFVTGLAVGVAVSSLIGLIISIHTS